MVQGQKSVIEVQCGDLVGHFGVVGTAGVAVAEDDVVKPVWDHTLCVHQVSDGLQHCLKCGDGKICDRYQTSRWRIKKKTKQKKL